LLSFKFGKTVAELALFFGRVSCLYLFFT
jgi:hypothetical protein